MPTGHHSAEVVDRDEDATLCDGPTVEPASGATEGGLSRRQVLRRFVGAIVAGVGGGLLAVGGPSARVAEAETVTTRIIVDGEVVLRTRNPEFAFTEELPSGCHTVRVVQRSSSGSIVSDSRLRLCSDSATKVEVTVSGAGKVELTAASVTDASA
jgi:hypothetical protein